MCTQHVVYMLVQQVMHTRYQQNDKGNSTTGDAYDIVAISLCPMNRKKEDKGYVLMGEHNRSLCRDASM